jgi:O-antigen/teichoic acid export membrane protein
MESGALTDKLLKNTFFNTIGRFWGIAVNLLLTPYIISRIGIERFGVWAVVAVLTGYLGLLDFGVGSSFVKFIAQYDTKKEYHKLNQVINTGFFFNLGLGIIIIFLGLTLINPLLGFFSIPALLRQEARFVFLVGIVLFAISNTCEVFIAIPNGLQRMEITNLIKMIITIPKIGGTIFFLENGYGLSGLMLNSLLIYLCYLGLTLIAINKILPQWNFNPACFKIGMLRELFDFGIKFQLTRVSMAINTNIDKIFISHFLTLALVTYYQLGSTIIMKFQEFSLLLVSAFIPAASELFALGDKDKLVKLYHRGTKYVTMLALPLATLIFVFAPLIMLIWMGPGYLNSVRLIQWLTPAVALNLLAYPGVTISLGIGKPELILKAAIFQILLNVLLNLALILRFGFIGVIWGTAISYVVISFIFLKDFHQHIDIPPGSFYLKLVGKPLGFCFVMAAPLYLINHKLKLFNMAGNRLGAFLLFAVNSVVFLAGYGLLLSKSGYLDTYDKELVHRFQLTRIRSGLKLFVR